MRKLELEIHSCQNCPYLLQTRVYTADSWEYVNEWICSNMLNRTISSYVERNDVIPIPDWCPLPIK